MIEPKLRKLGLFNLLDHAHGHRPIERSEERFNGVVVCSGADRFKQLEVPPGSFLVTLSLKN